MITNNPIVDAAGRVIAPPQTIIEDRPAGPWDANRGAGIRAALAGEVPVRVVEAARVVTLETARLLKLKNDRREAELVTAEELAELANGRRV